MWTVTVDSNVPIKTSSVQRPVSPSPSDSGSRSRSRSFTPDKYLHAPEEDKTKNDVETLLSSSPSGRARASSFRSGRPPPSAVRAVANALRSRSQSPANGRGSISCRSNSISSGPQESVREKRSKQNKSSDGWREEQWKIALENAVDDMNRGKRKSLSMFRPDFPRIKPPLLFKSK
ncbi:hypothetical protein PoB_005106100, partial [Plakobranchus ocellatus]